MSPVASKPRQTAAGDATRKIVRTTTVELVTTAIRQRILSGELPPGEPVTQEALADELGVSRVPIREAITRLTGEGLLFNVPHKGAYVVQLSKEEVQETFEIRLCLEPWLFSQAIPHIIDAEIAKAEQLVNEMERAESGAWDQLNWRLHETLYLPAQRDITLQMLHDRSDRYFRFQVVQVPMREQSHGKHMGLIDACRKRDAKLGAKLLEQHVKIAA
ncbi:putative regulator PutR for proline utilization, GntR family [Candidatus Paraburkholderia calva]|nr:putative regulator PutR for proline utilization, GntR family [Candidatus Paraburkholderia calva]